MNKDMTILYRVHHGLYVNLTNRCSCACTFCVRGLSDSVGEAESLWLSREPTYEEVIAAFGGFDMGQFNEVVFCGFGEPTEAWGTLMRVARYVKETFGLPTRVNTNGLGSLICGRDIAPEFEGIIDTASISLNAPDAKTYQKIVRSSFGDKSFDAVMDFAREVKHYVPNVVMTTISHEDEEKCRAICEKLGVRYRIRAWAG
ncbi:TatD family nuclease-associated radical SAM protein [Ellagibacter isourolithinifaciens]|uniref:TatD family nuclease-associated radical SAM protein n=1 Tax=Ellagibacter isourolithinifaciens TaxID=2137581 RepID=UPI003AB0E0C0